MACERGGEERAPCLLVECYEFKRGGERVAACFLAEGEGELLRLYVATAPLYDESELDEETRKEIREMIEEGGGG